MDRIKDLLLKGVKEGIYPGAVLLVAKNGQLAFFHEVGHLTLIAEATPMRKHTIFDLASLTKPLATTLVLMRLVDEAKIKLDQPLSDVIATASLMDKKELTPRLLLNHSAGFTDWKPFYLDLMKYRVEERKRVLRKRIIEEPLAYSPGKGCLYSDLGFMILEWVIEEASGTAMHRFVDNSLYKPLSLENIFLGHQLHHGRFGRERFAPTEVCPWRDELVQGSVHDENAHVLGGYSGHAGLFGNAQGVFVLVNILREHYQGERDDYFNPATVREFFARQDIVDGCSWALGWDTPSPEDSSSGKYFSPQSVGHLGFTGTSIWMDLEKDVMVILLTNRIHPTRKNEKIKTFRPALHDLIMEELGHGQVPKMPKVIK